MQEDCHRRRKKLKPNIVEHRRKYDCLHNRVHFDGTKASIAQKLLKLRRAGEGMFASLDPRSIRPEHLIERAYKCVRPRRPFDRAVDAECDPARVEDHAPHLA